MISHLKEAWHSVGVPTQFLGEGLCPISISSPCTVYSGAHPSGGCLVPELKGLEVEGDCIYASHKKARGSVVVTTGYQDEGWHLRPSQGKVNLGKSQAGPYGLGRPCGLAFHPLVHIMPHIPWAQGLQGVAIGATSQQSGPLTCRLR